jgi:FkbM family methyltransferase
MVHPGFFTISFAESESQMTADRYGDAGNGQLFRNDIHRYFEIIRPQPSPFRLIRLGGPGDGGYLVPDDLEGIEACFSPGVNNTKNFEDDLCLHHGIATHLCDFRSEIPCFASPLVPGLQTFEKKWLDTSASVDAITLSDWIGRRRKDPGADLLLQMDIEGGEYKVLLDADRTLLASFRILVIEFHAIHNALYDPFLMHNVCLPLFNKIAHDFVCVHAHPNNFKPYGHRIPGLKASMPRTIELTFLRRDRFQLAAASGYRRVMIPHPLDDSHVNFRPPFFLESLWCGGRRPWRSHWKIQRERMAYSLRSRAGWLPGFQRPS